MKRAGIVIFRPVCLNCHASPVGAGAWPFYSGDWRPLRLQSSLMILLGRGEARRPQRRGAREPMLGISRANTIGRVRTLEQSRYDPLFAIRFRAGKASAWSRISRQLPQNRANQHWLASREGQRVASDTGAVLPRPPLPAPKLMVM